ncbi:U11/U12 small nuclear ribonucleoprotein 65 kDa protein [Raphanus sativus]|uniref:U11/U12 small nuclear ribonucleoprotein 65 kDa protein n=1 Tax=Raphanus sativus TaxID=3726 RepID=A0A6J0N6M5_RAPSA|nr:U11/U12 small nuclear ribonucleoprotein 65 kDa protein [Raphanus sativus]XP_018480317.1 U11/U12 small nuclear ribonucleoprotein 65 kDa protein [Raphanus sativus]XP_018480325.1 U11/U12 small nuclear ribonucleoprotein 65 kDa protein [Raphanus sativus]KAJ4915041.1 U11/U12 small nuclear ribonucleoprotein 65 kDa protein [Raphanus sativus]
MAAHPTSEPAVSLPTTTQVAEPLGVVITLLVRHLPDGIPHDIVSRLFSQYGASAVRPCSGGRLRNAAFVDFKNEAIASQAHRQLNGLRFLGKVLQVQRATTNKPNENKKPRLNEESGKDGQTFSNVSSNNDSKSGQGLLAGEPIAPKLGINYPFPPHLQYAYPPPDANILANITNALIAVPPLYTQVLHLMNKMNLPPPFRLALPTPPLPKAAHQPTEVQHHQSSSESEMESDEDTGGSKSGRKRARHETLVGPGIDKDVTHETVGVKPSSLTPKEMPRIKKNKHVLQIKITQKVTQEEQHKEDIELEGPAEEEPREEDLNLKPFASLEELEKGRLPPQDILSLPMFKNYTAGNPSLVLYIKNLAKDVITDDFYYIFGSQFGSIEAAKSSLGVRLMQEGRMRGQAFLTFPSVEVAHRALNLVNGFVFKGKPMIIQFGRNPGSAKPNE